MQRDEVIDKITPHIQELRDMGVQSLALFGSTVRNEARPDSDVDMLVDLAPPNTFRQYMKVKFFLQNLLGLEVDLIMRTALKDELRSIVEREAVHVA